MNSERKIFVYVCKIYNYLVKMYCFKFRILYLLVYVYYCSLFNIGLLKFGVVFVYE